ncbi:uncharacterized protein LOC5502014 isoform X2 [Nematostella vectensis]|uniref:uncharacterized protein LOC5502014 isoform X2 n=1 Tax=Nematostella vectensis TaxID=45351 RepID=UPI002076FD87|nr:uncharacterized protein LOC5502014 isoform X2 [Nematostella vectensis]
MPRKHGLIKTYGRHKFRAVKTELWTSPEDSICSPVSKKDRKSLDSSPTILKKTVNTKIARAESSESNTHSKQLVYTNGKENTTDSFAISSSKLANRKSRNPLQDKDFNSLKDSRINGLSVDSDLASNDGEVWFSELDISKDLSMVLSCYGKSTGISNSVVNDSLDGSSQLKTSSRLSNCYVIPESPGIVKGTASSAGNTRREDKSLSFIKDRKSLESPLIFPQVKLGDISTSPKAVPNETSTPIIRANSRNCQFVTSRGRRKNTTRKPPKNSDSWSECQVLLQPVKITPSQFEAARRLSQKSSTSSSKIGESVTNNSSIDSLNSQEKISDHSFLSQSPLSDSGSVHGSSIESDVSTHEIDSNAENLAIADKENLHKGSGDNLSALEEIILKSENEFPLIGRTGSGSSISKYTGPLMECVVSLEKLQLDDECLSSVARRLSTESTASTTDSSVASLPPGTPPKNQKSHLSLLDALTPCGTWKEPAEKVQQNQLSPYEKILLECEQEEPVTFASYFESSILKKCVKIGEGVYGEVFKTTNAFKQSIALKIVPINGDIPVNGEPQKSYEEIMPEIVISKELSALNNTSEMEFAENSTPNFIDVHRVSLVRDRYPPQLLKEWDRWDKKHESENDRPDYFPDDQYFIIFEYANGGEDLERFRFRSLPEAVSVLHQIAVSLAVAERALQFEHRDLHWGNVLIARKAEKQLVYMLDGERWTVESRGLCVSLIDFTLSRLRKEGVTVFCDLSEDESMFTGQGDYQFDIYRKMRVHNRDDWAAYKPYSNVLWLHYLTDKILNNKEYPNRNKTLEKKLKCVQQTLTDYQSAQEVVHDGVFDLE